MSRRNKKNRKRGALVTVLVALLIFIAVAAAVLLLHLLSPMPEVPETPVLTIELGSPMPSPEDFIPDSEEALSFTSDMNAISMNEPGEYEIELSYGGRSLGAILVVEDTVAPTAETVDISIFGGESIEPRDFLRNIYDLTDVTVAFAQEPVMSHAGGQIIELLLRDTSGNETLLQAKLSIVLDTVAPVISGVKDIRTYAGDTVAYRKGVSASDDSDSNVQLEVDSSGVDLTTPGTYTVIYKATDAAGNTASAEAQVEVLKKIQNHVDPEIIYEAVDAQLAKFIRDDMSDREKAEAVYLWTHVHFDYGGHTEPDDYVQRAYEFLTTRRGDCYASFALQKLMLERLGIPTIDVKKVPKDPWDSMHYWLLVSIDGGENYYHYDNVWSMQLCLVTDEFLDSFSKIGNGCFRRDKSLYPATPTEPLPESTMDRYDPVILGAVP